MKQRSTKTHRKLIRFGEICFIICSVRLLQFTSEKKHVSIIKNWSKRQKSPFQVSKDVGILICTDRKLPYEQN
jgi:hypothetical protein